MRAADAIIKAVQSDAPPLNLILGKEGLTRVRAKLGSFNKSLDAWGEVTLSADFPPG